MALPASAGRQEVISAALSKRTIRQAVPSALSRTTGLSGGSSSAFMSQKGVLPSLNVTVPPS